MANIFGFEITRKKNREEKNLESFVAPSNDDGALNIAEGGGYSTYIDLDGSVKSEAELVTRYRQLALDPIIDFAIQDIVNEAIVDDSNHKVVTINLEQLEIPKTIKNKINEEFEEVLKLLEFGYLSYELFRRWYIDGRLYYHIIIDPERPKEGIKQLRYIDPRCIKKVREIKKEKTNNGIEVEKLKDEFFLYKKSGFMSKSGSGQSFSPETNTGLKITKDSILHCTSGYQDVNSDLILSYLHKAIRPHNILRSVEDSMVIYRVSRAPEKRIHYIDVGGLPKAKAEQYVQSIMNKFKNKVVYDSSTGEIKDDRKFMTMLEDFWLPRRDGNRGTEITTLPAGANLGEIEDIVYFRNLLYRALNVPISRMDTESSFNFGRATEISRDEVKFTKFIIRLRRKFSAIFTKLLERQLLLKGICSHREWENWKNRIYYDFAVDNFFSELKSLEINRERINHLREIDEYVGKYFSHDFVRRNVLRQTDEEIEKIDSDIEEEKKDSRYADVDMEDFGLQTDGNDEPPEPPEPLKPKSDEKKEQDE